MKLKDGKCLRHNFTTKLFVWDNFLLNKTEVSTIRPYTELIRQQYIFTYLWNLDDRRYTHRPVTVCMEVLYICHHGLVHGCRYWHSDNSANWNSIKAFWIWKKKKVKFRFSPCPSSAVNIIWPSEFSVASVTEFRSTTSPGVPPSDIVWMVCTWLPSPCPDCS